jgi:hypothetical protein
MAVTKTVVAPDLDNSSIGAAESIGEPQAVHCGPWFCVSSMRRFPEVSPQFGVLSSPASQPAAFDLKGSDAMTLVST